MWNIEIKGTQVIDLSQTIEPGIPMPVGVPGPQFEALRSQQKGDVANVELLWMSTHTATHCDAPSHFFSHLQQVDQLSAGSLIGPAVVVDMTHKQGSAPIAAQDFRTWEVESGETIRAGDVVLLRTDHSRNWKLGQDASAYWEKGWPYLTPGAVEYLVSKPIQAIGVESFDPDWVDLTDLSSARFPAHRSFLAQGILVIENLANLDKIPGTRCQIIALPLKLKGCSASPVRVVAVT